MTDPEAPDRWRPSRTNLVAGGLVIAGLLLTGLNWWFLLLAALGACGPGLLRELGWLHDRDEFQRQAEHRAGYHAFLATGFVAFALVAFFRSGERVTRDPQELATLFLALLWFSWLFSSLLSYWGPRRTAARILYAFGSVWLVFAVMSNLGQEWTGWAALLLQPLIALPFLGLAWLSSRRPRVSGVLLLAASVLFLWFFGWFRRDSVRWIDDGVVFILFIGPLLAGGIALLGARKQEEDEPVPLGESAAPR